MSNPQENFQLQPWERLLILELRKQQIKPNETASALVELSSGIMADWAPRANLEPYEFGLCHFAEIKEAFVKAAFVNQKT